MHPVYSVLLVVLIHQTVAFHSSFLLSFSPHTSESLLTLLRSWHCCSSPTVSHDCSSSSCDCIHSSLCFPSRITLLLLPLTLLRFTSDTAVLHSSHDCKSTSRFCLHSSLGFPSLLKMMRSLPTLFTDALHLTHNCPSSSRCCLYYSLWHSSLLKLLLFTLHTTALKFSHCYLYSSL